MKYLLLVALVSCSPKIPESGIVHFDCPSRTYESCSEAASKLCPGGRLYKLQSTESGDKSFARCPR